MKKVLKIIEYFFLGILVLLLCVNVVIMIKAHIYPDKVPGLFGYKPFVVLSGSMQSQINVGDLVFVKEVDPESLKANDIIAFRDQQGLVTTHRIKKVVSENKDICFQTKGDNNSIADSDLVCSNSIEGKYVSRIARLGSLIIFIQQPLGFSIMIMSILLIGVIVFIVKNKQINDEFELKNEEERKAFEEFKKSRQLSKKD